METNWKTDIARIVYWKQMAAERDKTGALPWKLPRVGASPGQIADAEQVIGHAIPTQFREFLSLANGWEAFHVLTDLFGTDDLVKRRWEDVLERPEVESFLAANGWTRHDVTVIGGSAFELDVFLLASESARFLPGGVVWFAAEEIDRYDSFADFLAAMVNYNARIADKLAVQSTQ